MWTAAGNALKKRAISVNPVWLSLLNLDSTIKLDVRYATPNNFLGRPVYKEARVFLQRPAAEAMRAQTASCARKGMGCWFSTGTARGR